MSKYVDIALSDLVLLRFFKLFGVVRSSIFDLSTIEVNRCIFDAGGIEHSACGESVVIKLGSASESGDVGLFLLRHPLGLFSHNLVFFQAFL